ncbi:MAG TPA: UDP-glucose 4-epimerase GalE [Reyranella sp.]|nr:UDP-glucose 4-epimerase GalE [Reyranella sp.]
MRVLVAGGAGYIGSHTCKALARAGHTPVVYDNLHTGHEWAVKWGPFERGDLNDKAALAATFAKHKPEAVINFAALAYVGESNSEPTLYYRNNVAGLIALIETMRAHDIGAMVFSSSCTVYGVPDKVPIVETARQEPISPYGRSKLMGEMILRDACAAHGLGAVALRYFNAAGADPEGELGEEHDPETHLIPLVLQAAQGTRPHISVFGSDYPTPDGTCIRDYIHVTDLATAHVAALSACTPGRFAAYNLGTGAGSSINEVVGLARQITRRTIVAKVEGRRPGDPPKLVADASSATTALGWRAQHSGLDEIVDTAWRWINERRTQAMTEKAR